VRILGFLCAALLLAACSGAQADRGGHLAKEHYLSAIQAVPAPVRTGVSGAPMVGLVVSGTITNGSKTAFQCSRSAFVLVRSGDGDIAPLAEFCMTPTLAPKQSTYFNATFPAPPRDDWQLRFEHGDGSYEVHSLAVPPG
jgi:hypothetical protein